jgi:hypothetical protein
MMGWPQADVDTRLLTTPALGSLIGESLHLGCLSMVLMAVVLTPGMPWWDSGVFIAGSTEQSSEPAPSTNDKPKRRRLGPIRRASSA